VEDELIIQTFEYLGAPGEVSLDRLRFEQLPGGRTRLVGRSVMTSREALEQMVASGMEYGVREGYEKLDELLTRTAA
ncbi:ATPase, partial [Bacillus sp. SIMBA_069]